MNGAIPPETTEAMIAGTRYKRQCLVEMYENKSLMDGEGGLMRLVDWVDDDAIETLEMESWEIEDREELSMSLSSICQSPETALVSLVCMSVGRKE